MIALLDVNVLIALFDASHVHHETAHDWMGHNRARGWATCPVTQNGCIRVLSQLQRGARAQVTEIVRRLHAAVSVPEHTFWHDSISLCDASLFESSRILTPKNLTDIYLLALAGVNGGRLVTFDRAIPLSAVTGATETRIVVL